MNLVVLSGDRLILRNVSRLATTTGLEVVQTSSLGEVDAAESPTAVVIDLDQEGGLDAVAESKERWPEAMVVGLVRVPGGELWKRAELAGADLVTTRGAVTKVAPDRLAAWMVAPGGRRMRLFAIDEIAGRLGVVQRLVDPVAGPLAAYHVGGEVCVVADVCPHAGARLSEGEVDVDNGIVTCPEHGSRFDTCTGERVRGPSDEGLRTFRVVIEDGRVYVQLDQT
jgi:nitrite reductase/ring-hydroxylating ferredoxin subunit